MPFDTLMQLERERKVVAAPGPTVGKLGHDGAQTVLRLVLIIDDQVVENRHRRHVHRERRFFVDREARRRLAMMDVQDAAVFRLGRLCGESRETSERSRRQGDEFCSHYPPRDADAAQTGWQPIFFACYD